MEPVSETAFRPLVEPSDARGLAMFEEIVAEIEAAGFQTWGQAEWISRPKPDGGYDDSLIFLADLTSEVRARMVPSFDCGTVACLFGHAVFKAGATMALDTLIDAIDQNEIVLPGSTERAPIFDYASGLLHLPAAMANWLSRPSREWPEIRAFLQAWRDDEAIGLNEFGHRKAVVLGDSETPW